MSTDTRPPASMPPPPPGTGMTTGQQAPPAAAAPQPAAPEPDRPRREAAPRTTSSLGESTRSRLLRGLVWGVLGMAAAVGLLMWASALSGDVAIRPLLLMTTVTEGAAGLVQGPLWQGILTHVLLGAVLGLLFALVMPSTRPPRAILLGALVLGAGVYAVDFLLIAPALLSPVFELRDEPLWLASRLVFGAVMAIGFLPGRRAR